MEKESRNDYIKSKAIWKGKIKGLDCFIVPGPMAGLNGYVNFPKRIVREKGYEGILTYVPVHGGITLASEDKNGMLYGFDTAHSNSDKRPITETKWIKKQIRVMIDGILLAQKIESKYLRCLTNKGKAKYADMILNLQRKECQNFGVMLNLLGGKV